MYVSQYAEESESFISSTEKYANDHRELSRVRREKNLNEFLMNQIGHADRHPEINTRGAILCN